MGNNDEKAKISNTCKVSVDKDYIAGQITVNRYLSEEGAKKVVEKLRGEIKSTDDKLTASDAGLYKMIIDNEIQSDENYRRLFNKISELQEENKKLYRYIIALAIVSVVMWMIMFTLFFS